MAGKIVVSEIVSDATSSNLMKIGRGATLDLAGSAGSINMPTGGVLQVVSTTFTGVATGTNTTPVLVSGMSASITPSSATSKILIQVTAAMAASGNQHAGGLLYKDGSELSAAHQSDVGANRRPYFVTTGYVSSTDHSSHLGNMIFTSASTYLDTAGGTSAITYALYMRVRDSGQTWTLNKTTGNYDADETVRPTSSITLTEVAG